MKVKDLKPSEKNPRSISQKKLSIRPRGRSSVYSDSRLIKIN
jgi:hypothetical protein